MEHSNTAFLPKEKFLYLTNSSTDRAAEAIRGTRIIVENYQQTIGIIKVKVGNRQDNKACHIREEVFVGMKGDKHPNTTHNRETSPSSTRSERRQQKRVSIDQSNNTLYEQPKYDSKPRYEHTKGDNSSRKQQISHDSRSRDTQP
uniref:Gag-pol polyprotein n=1 Tax=Heterorhabditis bacteriophora TaxID=37862 RepID=A0A1I7WRD9_HETBA